MNIYYIVTSSVNFLHTNNIFLNKLDAEKFIINMYLNNYQSRFYILDNTLSNFSIEKIIILDKINQFIENKQFSEAAKFIIDNFVVYLKEHTVPQVDEPKPILLNSIQKLLKEHIFK